MHMCTRICVWEHMCVCACMWVCTEDMCVQDMHVEMYGVWVMCTPACGCTDMEVHVMCAPAHLCDALNRAHVHIHSMCVQVHEDM